MISKRQTYRIDVGVAHYYPDKIVNVRYKITSFWLLGVVPLFTKYEVDDVFIK